MTAADEESLFKNYSMKNNAIMMRITTVCCVVVLTTIGKVWGQTGIGTMPKIVEKDGRHALLVDGQPFFMLGGQAHNSSGWPGMLPQVWSAVKMMHANTLEVPIYWEQIESQPGEFYFSLVDTLLKQGRKHNVHLVLLWFATWKNGSNHYMPEWMKHDAGKYPNITGKNGQPVDSPSPHTKAAMEADAKAFAEVPANGGFPTIASKPPRTRRNSSRSNTSGNSTSQWNGTTALSCFRNACPMPPSRLPASSFLLSSHSFNSASYCSRIRSRAAFFSPEKNAASTASPTSRATEIAWSALSRFCASWA